MKNLMPSFGYVVRVTDSSHNERAVYFSSDYREAVSFVSEVWTKNPMCYDQIRISVETLSGQGSIRDVATISPPESCNADVESCQAQTEEDS